MNTVYKILAFLLPTASVDAAVKALAKAANKLAAAEAIQVEKSQGIENEIARLKGLKAETDAAADRAKRVREKLVDLVA